jgi:hypothetical protein
VHARFRIKGRLLSEGLAANAERVVEMRQAERMCGGEEGREVEEGE